MLNQMMNQIRLLEKQKLKTKKNYKNKKKKKRKKSNATTFKY